MFSALVLCIAPSSASVPTSSASVPWTLDPSWSTRTANRTGLSVPSFTLSLDDDPSRRWDSAAKQFTHLVPAIMDYLKSEVPAWSLPILEVIGASVRTYFGDEYGAEMKGVAKALGIDVGYIVFLNLIMQIEEVGINCSNWNTTGPTQKDDPGCKDIDPSQSFCYCKHAAVAGAKFESGGSLLIKRHKAMEGPGACTSVVAQDASGAILHGRNLDWNLPEALRHLVADITFTRGGKPVFTGTGAVGFVGFFNGMVGGEWSGSINARGKGGKLLTNLLQSLRHKSTTPSMHLRSVLTSSPDFASAVAALSLGEQIDENYFIVAGIAPGEGAVLARSRHAAIDTWRLNASEPNGWYRLQTNYDRTNPVPVSDDRRTPGNAAMLAMGQAGLAVEPLRAVMHHFPTFNPHTDYTGLFVPKKSYYNSTVWMG